MLATESYESALRSFLSMCHLEQWQVLKLWCVLYMPDSKLLRACVGVSSGLGLA